MLNFLDANRVVVLPVLYVNRVEQQQLLNAGPEDWQALHAKQELLQLVVYVNRVQQQQAGHAGLEVQLLAHVKKGGHQLTNSRFFLAPKIELLNFKMKILPDGKYKFFGNVQKYMHVFFSL